MENMKIIRNICGTDVEIELTLSEMVDAHYEVTKYDTEMLFNDRLMQEHIGKLPTDVFNTLVKEVMDECDTMDENMGSNIFPAMNAVIEKNAGLLAQYKDEPYLLYRMEGEYKKHIEYSVRAKNPEDASRIFFDWIENHTGQFDYDLNDIDGDIDWDEPYVCKGNPEHADIKEEN